ncbi:MAG: serpin family protein, partial [Bacteroidales bacterium]|nr:serpin family protein [Bacteroidales bacterium]
SGCTSDDGGDVKIDVIDIPTTETIELTPAEKTVNARINDAAFDLLNQMAANYDAIKDPADNSGNITVSPLSVSLALAMRANSVDGTEQGICDLYDAADVKSLNALANKLMRYLSSDHDGTSVKLANSVWYDNGLELSPEYADLMHKTFYAETNQAGLGTPEGVDLINAWVRSKTGNMIDSFLDRPVDLAAVLLNAMYFEGEWPFEFWCEAGKFHGANSDADITMISHDIMTVYGANDDYVMARLPYKGDATITFVVPRKMTALEAAKTITRADIDNIDSYINEFMVWLPKFSISQGWTLTDILSLLGVKTSGSLRKMGIALDNVRSEIIHKTALEINEKGTRAAAATGDGMISAGAPVGEPFIVDRPFLFFIENTVTGSMIMCGCINNL